MAYENAILKADGGQVSSLNITKAIKIKKLSDNKIQFKDCIKVKSFNTKKYIKKDLVVKKNTFSKFKDIKKADLRKNKFADRKMLTESSDNDLSQKKLNNSSYEKKDVQSERVFNKTKDALEDKKEVLSKKSTTDNVKSSNDAFVDDDIIQMLNSDSEIELLQIMQLLIGVEQSELSSELQEELTDDVKLQFKEILKEFKGGNIEEAIELLSNVLKQISTQMEQIPKKDIALKNELDNVIKMLEVVESEEFSEKLIKFSSENKAQNQNTKDSRQDEQKFDNQLLETTDKDEIKVININEKKQMTDMHINKMNQNANNKSDDVEGKIKNSLNAEISNLNTDKTNILQQVAKSDLPNNNLDVPSIKSTPTRVDMMNRVKMAQNIMNQVIDGTKTHINNLQGVENITLRLKPAELGQVDLKISIEKGILLAQFQVESKIVKEALESNMADLKQALEEKGYSVEGFQVSVNKDDEQSARKEMFEQNFKRKYFFSDEDGDELIDFESVNKTLLSLQSTFEYLG